MLVLGYFVVVVALLGVVAGVAGVQTQRQRLFALADAAALDAADALAVDAYYAGGLGPAAPGAVEVPLTDASVLAAVQEHLAGAGAVGRFEALAVLPGTGSPDGATAQVVLRAVATPPLLPRVVQGWAGGVPITVTARARAAVD